MQEKQQIPINLMVNLEEKENKEDTSNKLLLHYSQNAVDIRQHCFHLMIPLPSPEGFFCGPCGR